MKQLLIRIRRSLSLKLSLSVLLMAIPIFLFALGILFLQSRHIIKNEAEEHATATLNTTIQRLNARLMQVKTATDANAWLVRDNMQPDSLLAITRRIVMLNGNADGCSITTEPYFFPQMGRYFSAYTIRDGDSIITVREGQYDYFSKLWYKTPETQGKACWVGPFDDYNPGTLYARELLASYCKPLYDDEQTFIGVISTDIHLSKFAAVVEQEVPYPNAYYMMVANDGHYYIHPDSSQIVSQTIFDGRNPQEHADIIALGHEMVTGAAGTMKVKFDGKSCLVCYSPVANTPWSLALVCPVGDMLYNYNRLTLILIPLLVIGLLLILLFVHHIVLHSVRPLYLLLEQTELIAEGSYDRQIATTGRRDAVGGLQNSFSAMQKAIDSHVSAISQANSEAQKRNEQLREASQLAEVAGRQKTAFIQNMTHQIRTPLNIAMGFAQVLHDNADVLSADEVKSITAMMSRNAKHLSRMTLMLYDSSDTGISEEEQNISCNERISCNEVARECIANTIAFFPGTTVSFDTALPDDFCISSNHLYLVRTLRELIYNAAKYSDGTNITMTLSKTDTTVRFVVEDTGPGITDDYIEQIFTPFAKVNDLSEGLGLGLPLSKRHAINLGGDLTLDPDYREGCRFTLELPFSKH